MSTFTPTTQVDLLDNDVTEDEFGDETDAFQKVGTYAAHIGEKTRESFDPRTSTASVVRFKVILLPYGCPVEVGSRLKEGDVYYYVEHVRPSPGVGPVRVEARRIGPDASVVGI